MLSRIKYPIIINYTQWKSALRRGGRKRGMEEADGGSAGVSLLFCSEGR